MRVKHTFIVILLTTDTHANVETASIIIIVINILFFLLLFRYNNNILFVYLCARRKLKRVDGYTIISIY